MAKPIGARAGREADIGKRVREIADRGLQPNDEPQLTTWIERADGDPAASRVEVKEGEPQDRKWLVVPALEAIEKGLARLPASGNMAYDLRPEYAAQTFPENLDYLKDLALDHEPASERAAILAFLNGAEPPDRLSAEEFFFFRLGEYCVTQCY